jgi:hypothetical protein
LRADDTEQASVLIEQRPAAVAWIDGGITRATMFSNLGGSIGAIG